jgi:HD superfamily phosphohydrolase YqeK
VARAAGGELPGWACMSPGRREHARGVADLLGHWAAELRLTGDEREAWRAAGWLHDSLRDAPPAELRGELGPAYDGWPDGALHGPAAAGRLEGEAPELLDAIRHHTLGRSGMGRLGRALYTADFLEPGRRFAPELRQRLRARMPHDLDGVTREVVAAKLAHLRAEGKPLHPATAAFLRELDGG